MDIPALKIFCEVYKQKGFSKASEKLSLTQSAVSQRVKALEIELGVPLFDDANRNCPTAAADYLFEEASLLLAQVEAMKNGVLSASGLGSGSVKFGMIDVVAINLMPKVLKTFSQKYPKVRLEASVKATGELVEMLARNEIDFAVAVTNNVRPPFEKNDIFDDSIVAVLPAGPRPNKKIYSIEDLKGEPLILYPETSHTRQVIEDKFKALGIVPTIRMEMHYPAAICSLVEQGMGIGLISRLSAEENKLKNQYILPIRELSGIRKIGVIRHQKRRLSPQARALIEAALKYCRKR